MKPLISILVLLGLAAVAGAAGDFSAYQGIIDRKPFGDETKMPAGGAAGLVPPAESPFKDLKLSAIIETPAGPQAGLLNVKNQKTYLLSVGDVEDGIEMVEIDYKGDRARVRIGTDEQSIPLGGAPGAAAIAPPQAPVLMTSPGQLTPATMAGDKNRRLSYAERKAAADAEQEKRLKEAAQALTGKALDEYLKEYQMNLIRQGGKAGPPLPLPLTPEMDAQLVKEGVLPPTQ